MQNTVPCFYALAEDAPFPHECTYSRYRVTIQDSIPEMETKSCLVSGHPVRLSISAEIRVAQSPREKWAWVRFPHGRPPYDVRCLCNVERRSHVIASLQYASLLTTSKSSVPGADRERRHSRLRDTTDSQNPKIAAKLCIILLRLKFYWAVLAEQLVSLGPP